MAYGLHLAAMGRQVPHKLEYLSVNLTSSSLPKRPSEKIILFFAPRLHVETGVWTGIKKKNHRKWITVCLHEY
jgi:hypothetical protein